mmetsp:Transcript_20344/g.29212  ORF Transcript_20344/g.29212 Transcript_20344/m.29212 type:complete len:631 (+) Transcript_20344:50-1942(+)|eukprot:CAMPEP_0185039346 /NCGR_PEP_ID=MMETSP1103-20130426/36139_1 /TAXON_ID=36769 /ORGANISM="Paraphysomonas bandaiensis, Strain Caron Lab Isolate" /LENGTH=630 /DNA_ID=CAMNT_0027578203 /DNA_START=40 /DNA_END=1932 /DNA_ORIENTATION=-
MPSKQSRKQILQQKALEKKKIIRRFQKQQTCDSMIISDEMITRAAHRSVVDRIHSFLPGRKKPKPKNVCHDPKPKPHEIPYQSGGVDVPWLPHDWQEVGVEGLADELERFAKYVDLDDGELKARECVLRDLSDAVSAKFPDALVRPFGSYVAGLSIFLSDVDITILGLGVGGNEEEEEEDIVESGDVNISAVDPANPCDGDSHSSCSYSSSDERTVVASSDISFNSANDCDMGEGFDLHVSMTSNLSTAESTSSRRSSRGSVSAEREQELSVLRALGSVLRGMDWVSNLEVRSKARVPIINTTHRAGIELDVSLGLPNSDTSALVARISTVSGYQHAFRVVSSFLKVFLHQMYLDKPFTGGIGSYKLYVMLAHVIVNVLGSIPESDPPCDPGRLLVTFFRHFGVPANLNKLTALHVLGAEADFSRTDRVEVCQAVFTRAYNIIKRAVAYGPSKVGQGRQLEGERRSLLSLLLVRHEAMCRERLRAANQCIREGWMLPADKDRTGQRVLSAIQKDHGGALGISWEEVKRVDPVLWERLRCISNVNSITRGRQEQKADNKRARSISSRQDTNGSGKKRKRMDRDEEFPRGPIRRGVQLPSGGRGRGGGRGNGQSGRGRGNSQSGRGKKRRQQ